jgi:DNA adenine methylase
VSKVNGEAKPILRWAGGKRRLVHDLTALLPARWGTYVEPMAGSAALFFHLAPRKAVLADVNPDLMDFYKMLRDNTSTLVERLTSLRASKALYYKMRESTPTSRLERAVRFAYLNRLCWNGLHRVNRRGDFNVPIGDRRPKKLWDPRQLSHAGKLLRNAKLVSADFEQTLSMLKKGDLTFIDPPYPRGALENAWFNRYSSDFFSLEEHRRLGKVVRSLDDRGIFLMLLVASYAPILKCYPSNFVPTTFSSKSLISGKSSSRRTSEEVVLRNYSR